MKQFTFFTSVVPILAVLASSVHAAPILIASGTGSQELPAAVDTDATCVLAVRHIAGAPEFPYTLQCFNITEVTQAHIHLGTGAESGSVAVFLFPLQEPTGDINGLLAKGSFGEEDIVIMGLTLDDLNTLMHNDGTYLNVHTASNPAGEVRGQVVALEDQNPVEEFFIATGTGSQQRPDPVETNGSCLASFRVKGDTLKYKVKCWRIEGVTQAHIHVGDAASAGAVTAFLFPLGDPTGLVNGVMSRANGDKSKGSLTDSDLVGPLQGMTIADLVEVMKSDGAYLNVHTSANPAGEVRGQITLIPTLAGGF